MRSLPLLDYPLRPAKHIVMPGKLAPCEPKLSLHECAAEMCPILAAVKYQISLGGAI